ncbi:phage tail assembly chaperone G [Leclercia adecarboxylata]|uniref:phage tail assembly chaperone G n=1 Tax=Leclercia adecarboxylata TaxID=83655 RepID=UPI000744AAFA|nr:phage minor tail protein G [Leclercia adecarboxylata]ALZ96988.1 hypothetical protein APT61_13605 [Leclercia adecarboxylata]
MNFLKSEPFIFNGNTIELFELSALQRIEHLQYLALDEKSLPKDEGDEGYLPLRVASNIRRGARLIAMSLWQGDTSKHVDALQDEVLSGWSPAMIGAGEQFVKKLSDMLPLQDPEQARGEENTDHAVGEEEVSAEKR